MLYIIICWPKTRFCYQIRLNQTKPNQVTIQISAVGTKPDTLKTHALGTVYFGENCLMETEAQI